MSQLDEPKAAHAAHEPAAAPAVTRDNTHPTPDSATLSAVTSVAVTATPLLAGERVGRYRIRRILGQGGMGRVYLARDELLGRSVALKVVRSERLGGSGERFAQEAQLLAALNHPHIVQVYDVGVCRAGPYLALEYIDGETLAARGPALALEEALRLLRAVADALAHAHARGVWHCDLKPGNVMVGRDGRLRVLDFGLARSRTRVGGGAEGTRGYMAPEQCRGEPLSEAVDVWAFALLALELRGAPHPFGPIDEQVTARVLDPTRAGKLALGAESGLPPGLATLAERSLEQAPALRPSVAEWLHALDAACAGGERPLTLEGPYRGLAPFGEEHARDFFGRDAELDAFLERLRVATLLPIAGPSGAGKSSFLFAGVVPRLRARGGWTLVAVRPGARPVEGLARALLAAGHLDDGDTHDAEEPTRDGATARGAPVDLGAPSAADALSAREAAVRALARELRETPGLLAVRLATLASAGGGGALLAIDQLEELFTHGADTSDVSTVLAMLRQAADDPGENTRVVVTVRDDFLGRIAGLRELFVLPPLGRKQLALAITGPLRRAGCAFDEPAIAERMIDELAAGSAAELPALQFTCRALWEGRDHERGLLLAATYRELGGVAGALAQHAERVLKGLAASEQALARRALLRLVAGTSRKVVARSDLGRELPGAEVVLDRLIAARLVVQRTAEEGEAVVELAHESLLTNWARLAGWLDESREERRLVQELREAAELWQRRGCRPEETWPADELAATRRRLAALGAQVPPAVEELLTAGEQRQRALRSRALQRRVLVGISAALVTTASVLFASVFRRQQHAAEEQAAALRAAGANLGLVELELAPFDWQDARARPVAATKLPELSWRVFGARADSQHEPGAELPAELVRRFGSVSRDATRIDAVELPGGLAFLRIDGRGLRGERCPPSWIRLIALPGYAARGEAPRRLVLPVPTCAASAADMVRVEAGPFVYGGPGEPALLTQDKIEPEQTLELGAFFIDRVELSNARFAPFAQLSELTGYAVPSYPKTELHEHAGDPESPVTAIDGFEAEAVCRYWGKRLPGDHEWVKAARGGLLIAGVKNPWPRRLYPWGPKVAPCSNDQGVADGFRWVAPVDSFSCGGSPYGVLNLAGNVSEWISRARQTDRAANPLWVIRGGDVFTPADKGMSTTVLRNEREGRQFTFAVGLRCVNQGDES